MRKIELALDGVPVTAQLLDNKAPKTCQALWDILPFEDMVTHSEWSGGRLHTTNHPKLKIDAGSYPLVENPSVYQAPGDVVVWPLTNEMSVSYAPGSLGWMGQLWIVSHVATIEGDMTHFARKIERLQWEGAKKLIVRRLGENEQPKPRVVGQGTKVEMESEGKRWVFELFDDKVPELCQVILDALPIEGPVTNLLSTGECLQCWVKFPKAPDKVDIKREKAPIEYKGVQIGTTAVAFYNPREMRGTNPGDLFFRAEGLVIVHGQAHFRLDPLPKVGRLVQGHISELSSLANRIKWEGAKAMKFKRVP